MNHYNMITGEPELPPNNGSNFGLISEQEVLQNANLMGTSQGGGYYYDTNSRMAQMQNSGFSNYMNPPMNNGQAYVGNPAFAAIEAMQNGTFQNPFGQAPRVQDQVISIPGFNPGGGELLLPDGIEETKRKLQLEMLEEQDLAYEKKIQKQQEFYQKTGQYPNYYGMPYISYDDPAVVNKYRDIVSEMRQEAMDARRELNMKLSALAHNYTFGSYDMDQIENLYEERTIMIPAAQVEHNHHQEFLHSMEPAKSTAAEYCMADAKVTEEHNKYFGSKDKVDLNAFLEGATLMRLDDMLNEEQQRRRDMTALYQQNSGYRSLIRASLIERRRRESGDLNESKFRPPSDNPFQLPSFENFPTLMESGKFMDDGSITITPPESIFPPNANPQTIMNENEQKYEKSRQNFLAAIYRKDTPPGGVG